MTESDTKKVLAMLKAAYPNSFKTMTREEAFGMIHVWQMQFNTLLPELVMLAVNRLIGKSTFPPSIAEVKAELHNVYMDAWQAHLYHDKGIEPLAEDQLKTVAQIEQTLKGFEEAQNSLTASALINDIAMLKGATQ